MDLQIGALSYQDGGSEVRYVIDADGVTAITDSKDHITVTKDSADIVLQKANLGSWTLHMFANVTPE